MHVVGMSQTCFTSMCCICFMRFIASDVATQRLDVHLQWAEIKTEFYDR